MPLVLAGMLAGMPVAGGSDLAGQSFAFHYAPTVGSSLSFVTRSEATWAATGFPLLPDSVVGLMQSLVTVTHRVRARDGERYIVDTVRDSARSRYQIDRFDWRSVSLLPEGTGGAWWVENSFRRAGADHRETGRLRGPPFGFGLDVPLPEGPVEVGASWSGRSRFEYASPLPSDSAVAVAVRLAGPTNVSFDSMQVRGTDTLAFVTLRGQLSSLTVEAAYGLLGIPAPVEIWGGYVAGLVWSTGWGGQWVSGVVRGQILHRVDVARGSGLRDPRLTADLVARMRIRP